jgi:hypothetical protein
MTNEDLNKLQYMNNEKTLSLRRVLIEKDELDRVYKQEKKNAGVIAGENKQDL